MTSINFAQELNAYLSSNYNLQADIDIDLYIDISAERLTYKTEICDRISDFIRLSPASIAKPFVDEVKAKGMDCYADSRGFIFFHSDTNNFLLDRAIVEKQADQATTLIYIQPPSKSDKFDFSYIKLISQALLQVRLLIESKQSYKVLIAASDRLIELHDPDFNQFAFKLIKLLREHAAKPSLKSLDLFNSAISTEQFNNSKTVFLTADILSINKVSDNLKTLRQSSGYQYPVNIHSQKLELESAQNLYDQLQQLICDKPLPVCIYLIELKHINDLDWDTLITDNWLNLNYALRSLFDRNKSGVSKNGSAKLDFVLYNLALTLNRSRNKGETQSLVQSLRFIAENGHKLLNKGVSLAHLESNSDYALLRDLSNIIK